MRNTDKSNLPSRRRVCGKCGRLGHLTRTCTRPDKAHVKIGVEVEGWWRDLNAVKRIADNWHMSGTEDGSLAYDETDETLAYEFRTLPGSLGEAISQVIAVYPDKCDPSAGMHVHMSFNDPADISCLASAEFLTYFRERWEAWGRAKSVHTSSDFWSRLHGDNDDYCAINREHELTTNHLTAGSRYRQLNFTSFRRHQTMEMRMLPLFRDARLAVLALEEWVAIVEDFLTEHADRYLAQFDRAVPCDFPPVYEKAEEFPLAFAESTVKEGVLAMDEVREVPTNGLCNHCGRRMQSHYTDFGDPSIFWCLRSGRDTQRGTRFDTFQTYAASRTVEADLGAPLDTSRSVTGELVLPDVAPPTPDHIRIFGGTNSVLTRVRNTLVAQGVR